MDPKQAWLAARGQLQMDMPRNTFDTHVRSTELGSYDDGSFILCAPSAYARDWLESRLTSTVTRLLTGIMNRSVSVRFECPATDEDEVEDEPDSQDDENGSLDQEIHLEPVYGSFYDAIVRPHQIIAVNGYFRRWIPILGSTLAWIVVGLYQVAFLSLRRPANTGDIFDTNLAGLAFWSGISRASVWRHLRESDLLQWFIRPSGTEEGHFAFRTSMPLTPDDAAALEEALLMAGIREDPVKALQSLLLTGLKLPEVGYNTTAQQKAPIQPMSIQDVIKMHCRRLSRDERKQVMGLSDELAARVMPNQDVIVTSHYFVRNWVPRLGPGPAWLVTLMRDQAFVSKDEVRDIVHIKKGYGELSRQLGEERPKTVCEWLEVARPLPTRLLTSEVGLERRERRVQKRVALGTFLRRQNVVSTSDGLVWDFVVALKDPLTTEHQALMDECIEAYSQRCKSDGEEAALTEAMRHITCQMARSKGANETAKGANETTKGAFEITKGANETAKGAFEDAKRRERDALSSLNTPLNTLISESTTTPPKDPAREKHPVVGDAWHLETLLTAARVSPTKARLLQRKNADPKAWVSWLLYAHGADGIGINDPIAHTVARLVEAHQTGPGGVYERLASLPPRQLVTLIVQQLNRRAPSNLDWRTAFEQTKPRCIRALAAQLGIPEDGLLQRESW